MLLPTDGQRSTVNGKYVYMHKYLNYYIHKYTRIIGSNQPQFICLLCTIIIAQSYLPAAYFAIASSHHIRCHYGPYHCQIDHH